MSVIIKADASQLGIEEYYCSIKPEGKAEIVMEQQKKGNKEITDEGYYQ